MQTYPIDPGYTEATTSLDAAVSMSIRAETLRKRILAVLIYRPMTSDESAEAIGESVLAVRPRLTELRRMGLIERTGQKRKNESGLYAHEYRQRRAA